ncbi:MAG: Ig-like domain-containing protein [Gemmatimonadota bacterium]|nr:Ig-like domain-containing protein [Gemmatimonadota bacterium]
MPESPRATTVVVTPSIAQLSALGAMIQLSAQVLDQNGREMAGAAVVWESGDDAVATVDGSGLVTAVGNGTTTVTATAGAASGSAAVTVVQSADSVAVEPVETTITALGDTVRLAAEAFDANGHPAAGAEFSWESGDAAVATVDGSGLVTAVGNGTTTVTATAGAASGSAAVTVVQSADSVAVEPVETTITALGDTVRLAAEAFDANGHPAAGAEFSWESGDAAVATVDGSGLVTAVGNGTTTVTATAGAASGWAAVNVVEPNTLSGTVTDGRRAGLGVPGATVRLGNGRNESTTTDVRGRYRFSNVSGRVKVTVSARPSYRDQTAEVRIGSVTTLDFTLEHTGKPPFFGTVWVTPDVLGPSDPTSFGSVTYAGRDMRWIFDRRVDAWIRVNAYLFDVQFGDWTVEWQFNPEFASRQAARAQIDVFAPAIGRLPAVLLSNLQEVEVNAGKGAFGGNAHNGSFLIHTEDPGTMYAVHEGFLEEVFLHEGAHVSLDPEHLDSPGWRAAQQADGVSISEYARDYPDREDVAESILPYFAVRYRPQRLTAAVRWLMMMTIPNRLAYFDEQELDMSPYTVESSIVVTAPIALKLPAQQETHWYGDPPIPPRRKHR